MSDGNGIAQLIQQLRIVSSLITDRKEQGCSEDSLSNLLALEGYIVGLIQDKESVEEKYPVKYTQADGSAIEFSADMVEEILEKIQSGKLSFGG